MAENDILNLFQGLSPDQVKQFRLRIVPTLRVLRDEIVNAPQASAQPETVPLQVTATLSKQEATV